MSDSKLMKDGLGQNAVKRLANALTATVHTFDASAFQRDAVKGLSELELRQRVPHIIATMHRHLPGDFLVVADCFEHIPEVWDSGNRGNPLSSFAAWPIVDYVAEHGLEHPDRALALLKRLTSLFSAEFAVRPFLIQCPKLALKHFHLWCEDPDAHVRRLASEGCRPRLPWGKQLKPFVARPDPVLALLEKLKDDPSDDVRRSVANNLNDISKDHPDRVIALCRRWRHEKLPNRDWIIRHATRTLVKAGHPDVFPLLGHTTTPRARLREFTVTPQRVRMGESITFAFKLRSTAREAQSLVLDYAIYFMKANGKRNAKVFKLRTLVLAPGALLCISKSHSFRPITTRRYYAGEHQLALMINGREIQTLTFAIGGELHGQPGLAIVPG